MNKGSEFFTKGFQLMDHFFPFQKIAPCRVLKNDSKHGFEKGFDFTNFYTVHAEMPKGKKSGGRPAKILVCQQED